MKSERRHELQHNTLDAELGKTVEFFRRHLNTILWAIVIFCAVLIGGNYLRRQAKAREFEHRIAFVELMRNPELLPDERIEQLRELADQDRDLVVAIDSLFMMANLQIESALLQLISPAEAAERAAANYREVIDRFEDHPIQVANAYIGLAMLAENDRDFEKAAEFYRQALSVEGAAGSPATVLAANYSETLPALRQPLGMTPPKLPESPATDELGDPGMPNIEDPPAFPLPGESAPGETGLPPTFAPPGPTDTIDPFGPDGQ